MKTYIAILVGVVALFGVVFVGYKLTATMKQDKADIVVTSDMQRVTGEVKRFFEGDNVLRYAFDTDVQATTTSLMDGALIRVTREDGSLSSAVYFSYEGGRGYTAQDYIASVIVPQVSASAETGTTIVGVREWSGLASASTEWFVTPVLDGQWLIVVEAHKDNHTATLKLLESLTVN